MRRALLIGVAALVLLAGGAVLAVRLLPYSFVERHFSGRIEVRGGEMPGDELHARLGARHGGPGPCLRSLWMKQAPFDVEPLAPRVQALGFTSDRLGELAGQFVKWGDEREAAYHAQPQTEELIAVLSDGSPWTALILGLNADRVRQMMEMDTTGVVAQGTAAFAGLTGEEQVGLRALWEEQPEAFSLGNLLQQMQLLRTLEVQARLEALARAVSAHLDREGDLAAETLELVAVARASGLPAEDAHGHPFALGVWPDRFELRTADGQARVEVPRTADTPMPSATPPASCNGPPGPVTLSRAVVDLALQNPTEVALQARIVPAVTDGEARGFKLYSVQPHSLFAKMGLCSGDLLGAINGRPLRSPGEALEAYEGIAHATRLTLDVERRGAPYKVIVHVR